MSEEPVPLVPASCELGEGSLWCGQKFAGSVLHNKCLQVDIYGPSLYSAGPSVLVIDPYTVPVSVQAFPLPSPCGTVVPDASGNSVLVALQDGVHRLDLLTKVNTNTHVFVCKE